MNWYKIKSFGRFYSRAIVAVIFLLLISVIIYGEVKEKVKERNYNLFLLRTNVAKEAVQKRIYDYIQILKGAQALVSVSDTVTYTEWESYIEGLEVEKNYPGVQGIGYAVVVDKFNIPAFERKIRSLGFQDFFIWPKEEQPYSSIIYLEPMDARNKRAFGYDMFSDSTRRNAMERARDTGKPALSGGVVLVQETKDNVQKGFNLYLPLYKKGTNPSTYQERRQAIIGFVYSPFRIRDLMGGIFGSGFDDLNLEIYHGKQLDPLKKLYAKNRGELISQPQEKENQLEKTITIALAENNWTLRFTAMSDFGYETNFPYFILLGGITVSLLTFIILVSSTNTNRSDYLKRVITDNATSALFILSNDGSCTFLNPAAEVMTGYAFEEVKNSNIIKLLHGESDGEKRLHEQRSIIQKALLSDNPIRNQEGVFLTKSKGKIYVSINSKPIWQGSKQVATLLDVRDISQEKEVEYTLRENNNNLRTLNKIGKDLSAELELNKLLQRITDSCTELTEAEFGAFFYNQADEDDPESKIMLHVLSGVYKDAFETFPSPGNSQIFAPTLTEKKSILSDDITKDPRYGHNLPHGSIPAGHVAVTSYLSVPVISRTGEVLGGLFFGHSSPGKFSERIKETVQGIAAQAAIAIDNSRLFETINAKNEELIKINNDLDNFVYTASHDLKAPVLNIEGLVYALTKALNKRDFDKVDQMIEMIKTSVLKFKGTIQALTEVAKTNKNIEEEIESIDLNELLGDIQLSIEDMIIKSGAEIKADLDCKPISFSKSNIRSILLNLITNAIKYSSPQRKPVIDIKCTSTSTEFLLQVSDNGLGISEEYFEKIFLMFKRVHTGAEGTGVGLYLVKRIVENHHGTIRVESKVGEGSTFFITLPFQEIKDN